MTLPCFTLNTCNLTVYTNEAINDDLSTIETDTKITLPFEYDHNGVAKSCFDKTSNDSIFYTTTLAYNCEQASGGLVTEVSKDLVSFLLVK